MFYFDLMAAAYDMGGFAGNFILFDLLLLPAALLMFAVASLVESIVYKG